MMHLSGLNFDGDNFFHISDLEPNYVPAYLLIINNYIILYYIQNF